MEKSQNMLDSDEVLMARYIDGDNAAFALLLRRHADPLLGFLYRMCKDRHRAEDLFQETFLRVHRRARTFKPAQPFKRWLYAIASHVAIDEHRQRIVRSYMTEVDSSDDSLSDVADPSPLPSDAAAHVERKKTVLEALEVLPPRQRVTVNLAYFEGMTYPEVAEVMGCSVGTVKTQMSRALAALERLLPDSRVGGAP